MGKAQGTLQDIRAGTVMNHVYHFPSYDVAIYVFIDSNAKQYNFDIMRVRTSYLVYPVFHIP